MARKNPIEQIKDVAIDALKNPKGAAGKAVEQARETASIGKMIAGQVGWTAVSKAAETAGGVVGKATGRTPAPAPTPKLAEPPVRNTGEAAAEVLAEKAAAPAKKTTPPAKKAPAKKTPAKATPAVVAQAVPHEKDAVAPVHDEPSDGQPTVAEAPPAKKAATKKAPAKKATAKKTPAKRAAAKKVAAKTSAPEPP